jgi:alpha-L-fucosidase
MGNSETGDINGWYWHPGESDAKATNSGWFWHSGEGIKSASRLFQMYLETVGRNATLILNCPPNNYGVLPTQTVNTLNELGVMLHERLAVPVYGMDESNAANDFAKTAQIVVSDERTGGNYGISNLTDGDRKTYWATNDNTIEASITLTWSTAPTVRYLVLQEPIELGQRVKDFKIEYTQNGSDWQEMAKDITTTVGYKRIIPLNGSTEDSYGNGYKVRAMRITILDSRACPLISNINVY